MNTKDLPDDVELSTEDAIKQLSKLYIKGIYDILNLEKPRQLYNNDELTFFKTVMNVENGGKYLLLLTHVDGPKIQMTPLEKEREHGA